MQVRPITPQAAVAELAERIDAAATPWVRVVVDGASPTDPGGWAAALVDPLRLRGRPAAVVFSEDFLRPASLRLEHGRHDPDAFYGERVDHGALRREVLDRLGERGSGRYLPRLWDPVVDRSARADYLTLPRGGVLLLAGSLLLGLGLPAELTVHLHLSDAALGRQLGPDEEWTLPAYRRYTEEAQPESSADLVLRVDHPDRPAMVDNA